jgi:hypothetical protein
MRKGRNRSMAGLLVLLALCASLSWYGSHVDSIACLLPVAESGNGTGLNVYSMVMANGAPGVAAFFKAIPDSYGFGDYWKGALHWTWEMRFPCGPGDAYNKWPHFQGQTGDKVYLHSQAGIGCVFIDAYADKPESTAYRDHAKEVARLLMAYEPDYKVLRKGYDEEFDSLNYWYKFEPPGENPVVVYHANGGVSFIGVFFLEMYEKVGDSFCDTSYMIAHRAAQYMKSVAIADYEADTLLRARWKMQSDDNADSCPTYLCWGTPGIVGFLDSMYVAASEKGDSDDSLNHLRWARAGLRWIIDEVEMAATGDTGVDADTLYWWYQYPALADSGFDTTYSPTWGRGAAGIGGTFLLVGLPHLAADSTDSAMYYRYARRAAKWVYSKANRDSWGFRWARFFGDTTGDTLYYTYFCRGQGPIIRFFAEMYRQSRVTWFADGDSLLYLACADSGRMYLDSTKVPGYKGGYCWDGIEVVPEAPDSEYIPISVSLENGPPGLGLALLSTAKAIGSATSADSADSVKFTELAFDNANWLKGQLHADTVFGGNKWSWRTAEDSITVKLISPCEDCTLDSDSTFVCTLWVYNHHQNDPPTYPTPVDTVFWWIDYLRFSTKQFKFIGTGAKADSGTIPVLANDSAFVPIEHKVWNFGQLSPSLDTVGVNGSVGYWLEKFDGDTILYSVDHDCFRMWVKE